MFRLDGNLKFLNIQQDYVKALYDVCPEVYYRPEEYANKTYLGILLSSDDGLKYVIPLSSAKEKHKSWKNVSGDRYLIYEKSKKSGLSSNDIFIDLPEDCEYAKHILAVMDIKKMIPVRDGLYSIVNLNPADTDTDEMKRYKDLLNKEYSFCVGIIRDVIEKANRIYSKQKKTGKTVKFGCDYSLLEAVCSTYTPV